MPPARILSSTGRDSSSTSESKTISEPTWAAIPSTMTSLAWPDFEATKAKPNASKMQPRRFFRIFRISKVSFFPGLERSVQGGGLRSSGFAPRRAEASDLRPDTSHDHSGRSGAVICAKETARLTARAAFGLVFSFSRIVGLCGDRCIRSIKKIDIRIY